MFPKAPSVMAALCPAGAILAVPFAIHSANSVIASSITAPAYTKNGDMLSPRDYRDGLF